VSCALQVRLGFRYDSADNLCIEITEAIPTTLACNTSVSADVEPSLAPLVLTESAPVLEPQGSDVSVVEEDGNTPVSLCGTQYPCLQCICVLKHQPDLLCSYPSCGELCFCYCEHCVHCIDVSLMSDSISV
jgi:hypothetical protein